MRHETRDVITIMIRDEGHEITKHTRYGLNVDSGKDQRVFSDCVELGKSTIPDIAVHVAAADFNGIVRSFDIYGSHDREFARNISMMTAGLVTKVGIVSTLSARRLGQSFVLCLAKPIFNNGERGLSLSFAKALSSRMRILCLLRSILSPRILLPVYLPFQSQIINAVVPFIASA